MSKLGMCTIYMKLSVQTCRLVALQTTLASLIVWQLFMQAGNFIFDCCYVYHAHLNDQHPPAVVAVFTLYVM